MRLSYFCNNRKGRFRSCSKCNRSCYRKATIIACAAAGARTLAPLMKKT